jgi:uncharacterized protein YqhQ
LEYHVQTSALPSPPSPYPQRRFPQRPQWGQTDEKDNTWKEKTEIQLMTFSLFFLTTYSLLFSLVLFLVCPSFIYLAVHLL